MQLKLKRSQREAAKGYKLVIFCLDARVDLTKEEQANVARYGLSHQVIYNSEAAKRHIEGARSVDGGTAIGFAKGIYHLAAANMALNITINSLQLGQHIECKTLDELLGAEDALMTACTKLKGFLGTAATFDGREVLIDFNQDEPTIIAPSYQPPPQLMVQPVAAIASEPAPIPISAPLAAVSSMEMTSSPDVASEPMYPVAAVVRREKAPIDPNAPFHDWALQWFAHATAGERAMVVTGAALIILVLLKIF